MSFILALFLAGWSVHGEPGSGTKLEVQEMPPPFEGAPMLVAISGTIGGQAFGGVGWLHIYGGGIWKALVTVQPVGPDAENPKKQEKPEKPPAKPWNVELDGKPANGQKDGDQDAGKVSQPQGNTHRLYN